MLLVIAWKWPQKYQNLLRTKKYLQMDSRWCMICISWKLFVLAKFLKSQQFKTFIKKNPSCIFLSLRANSKKTVCYDGPCTYCQIDGEYFVNFCGLLRKRELYSGLHLSKSYITKGLKLLEKKSSKYIVSVYLLKD